MTLKYDFDISYIFPEEMFSDPTQRASINAAGIQLNARNNYVAKFRDPNTVAALAGASEPVRQYFQACGFAFVPSGVTLPDGTFDARFDNHVTDVAKRFLENLDKFALPKSPDENNDWNGLDLGEVHMWIAICRPIKCAPAKPQRRSKGLLSLGTLTRMSLIFGLVYVYFAMN